MAGRTEFRNARWRGFPVAKIAVFLILFGVCSGLLANADSKSITFGDPLLQLNTGGPTAPIRSLLLNRDGSRMVAAGDDKVISIYHSRTFQLVRTIRGEVSEDIQGAITAMALSPDDRWLAVAVFYPHQENGQEVRGFLRIHDFRSGELVRLVTGHRKVMHTLKFSRDGSMLLGGETLNDGPRALIWDTATWQLKQQFKGHTEGIRAAGFTPDQKHIVTAGWDQSVRVWDIASAREVLKINNAHKGRIYAAAIPERSNTPIVVTGGTDNAVRIWNYETGELLREMEFDRKIRNVIVNPSGSRILAASVGEHVNAWIAVVDASSGKTVARYEGHDLLPLAMVLAGDGDTVYSSGGFNHEIDRWSLSSGEQLARLQGAGMPVQAVGISDDGNTVYWGHEPIDWSGKKYHFEELAALTSRITLRTVHDQLGKPEPIQKHKARRSQHKIGRLSLERTRPKQGGFYSVLQIKNGRQVVGTVERNRKSGHLHTAYTFTPDGKKVITGGEVGYLSIHDLKGRKLGDFRGHNGDITSVAVSGDGRLLVSGSHDQTFKVWNTHTTELLLSFFVGTNGEWIAWTSTGHYTSSPDGDQYIGWVINQGVDRNAEYVQAEQMRNKLYRPDIVNKVLESLDLDNALETSPDADFSVAKVKEKQVIPVDFEVVAPQNGLSTSEEAVNLKLQVDPGTGNEIDWSVTVNGRQVLNPIRTRGLARTQPAGNSLTFPLSLDPGENRIKVIADNAETSKVAELTVTRAVAQSATAKSVAPLAEQGNKLLVLSVGVNEYSNLPEHNLRFAAADADAIAKLFGAQQGRHYDQVETILLSDNQARQPTRDNIVDALDAMAGLGPDDTVIVFLAGHGVIEDSQYYFLPRDAALSTANRWKKSTVIAWREIQRAMQSSLGRRILLVDTCHSEGAFNSRLVKDADDSNIIVMSSTDSKTLAQEVSRLGHGVFTYALVDGLGGKADSYKDDRVTMSELNAYVANSVPSLTRNAQIPTLSVPGGFQDFVIASL